MVKNAITFLFLSLFLIAVCACGKNAEPVEITKELSFSDISAEDWEVIDFINQNSDCVFDLLGEMDVTEHEPGAPYTDISEEGHVKSYGFYIEEKQAVIRTQIVLNGVSERNILGVHNGDTIGAARDILEKAGFTCVEEASFNSSLDLITYSIGIVELSILVEKDENNADAGVIESVSITIRMNI